MDARAALRGGDVSGAMATLKQEVRAQPRDPRLSDVSETALLDIRTLLVDTAPIGGA